MFRVCVCASAVALCRAAPVVNLRLSPPRAQLPEVAAEIARLDLARDTAEAAGLRRLDAAYEDAVKKAGSRIHAAAAGLPAATEASPVGFLDAGARRAQTEAGFLVHV